MRGGFDGCVLCDLGARRLTSYLTYLVSFLAF